MQKYVMSVSLNLSHKTLTETENRSFKVAFQTALELIHGVQLGYMNEGSGLVALKADQMDLQAFISEVASLLTAFYIKESEWEGGGQIPRFTLQLEAVELEDALTKFEDMNPNGELLWPSYYNDGENNISGWESVIGFNKQLVEFVLKS